MPIDLTPVHLRCSLGGCPSVTRLDDGRLLIVGGKASANPETHLLGELGNVFVGADEEAVVISPDLLANLPEILHLRSQVAKLKQALEPFARWLDSVEDEYGPVSDECKAYYTSEVVFTIADFRRARAALTDEDKEKCDSSPDGSQNPVSKPLG